MLLSCLRPWKLEKSPSSSYLKDFEGVFIESLVKGNNTLVPLVEFILLKMKGTTGCQSNVLWEHGNIGGNVEKEQGYGYECTENLYIPLGQP